MKNTKILLSFLFIAILANSANSIADTDADKALIIRSGSTNSISPHFEIVSGEGEIIGDLSPSLKESYQSWKKACEAWKKEIKDLNPKGEVKFISCNSPKKVDYPNFQRAYRSIGTYKIRVEVRRPSSK